MYPSSQLPQAIVSALVEKGALPQEHVESTVAALKAHHHHAATKERHAMLQARVNRRQRAQSRAQRCKVPRNDSFSVKLDSSLRYFVRPIYGVCVAIIVRPFYGVCVAIITPEVHELGYYKSNEKEGRRE